MKLNDQSPMPFGKHKGEAMEDVPASYFRWLWNNGNKYEKTPVADYIRENLSVLQSEDSDGIWD